MTPENKKFILKKLCPFILREQGRGFMMAEWRVIKEQLIAYEPEYAKRFFNQDLNKEVKWPKCDSVFCIGGSAGMLLKTELKSGIYRAMGLSQDEGYGLFYNWMDQEDVFGWPLQFSKKFEKAKTPLTKAKVAVALLKEVVRTEGKCLHRS